MLTDGNMCFTSLACRLDLLYECLPGMYQKPALVIIALTSPLGDLDRYQFVRIFLRNRSCKGTLTNACAILVIWLSLLMLADSVRTDILPLPHLPNPSLSRSSSTPPKLTMPTLVWTTST